MRFLAAFALWQRELLRFVRQPSRVGSAVATPLLFWVVLGTGLGASFRVAGGSGGVGYLEYFFPGTVVLLVLFASIFSTISVIEDRQSGFLQGVLVAPAGRGALVAGKVLGGATQAAIQGGLCLLLAPLAGIEAGFRGLLAAAGVVALLAIGLTALGFAFAWRLDSTQGFHGVMNLLLFPMWFVSGAVFPLAGSPAWLLWLMRFNPLTYGLAALRRALYPGGASLEAGLPSAGMALAVTGLFVVATLATDLGVAALERRAT